MPNPRRALSRARGVLYETRTVLEQKTSSDPVLALDTTTSSLKAVEAALLAAALTIGFAAGWTAKFAADGTPVLFAVVALQLLVMAAALAAVRVTGAARLVVGGERDARELERSLDVYLAAAGDPGARPTAVALRRVTNATVIEVHGGPLTDELFAAVQAARGVSVGRHKGWSEHYVFDELDAGQADRIAALLAEADVAFTLDVTWEHAT